jgi:hypothetical protein
MAEVRSPGPDSDTQLRMDIRVIQFAPLKCLPTEARRRNGMLLVLAVCAAVVWSSSSRAQSTVIFPSGVSGYDQQIGVTVLSRLRPAYEPPGVQVGSFVIRPNLSQSVFDNTNVNGTPGSGSWGSQTQASVSAQSDWDRNSLAASVGVNHEQYFQLPNESYTDWNVGLAGGYTIGDSQLAAAYSHQSYHLLGTAIGTVQSQTPVLAQTDTAQLNYTFNFGRLAVTPNLSVSSYQYGNATVGGTTVNQQFLDRDVLAGGVTNRFSLSDQGGLLLVVQGVDSHYTHPQEGQPSNNSTSFLLMGGLDYQAESVWRYSLLAGVEVRSFAASQFSTRTAPIVEGTAIWTPTGVLTVTGILSRTIEDPESGGTNGFILSQGRLTLDYELMRPVLLQARGGIEYAQYLGEGNQTNLTVGGSVTWLLNRTLRLALDEDYTTQSSPGNTSNLFLNPASQRSGQYNQNLLALTLRAAF